MTEPIKNQVQTVNETPKFSLTITNEKVRNLINTTLGDPKKASRFIGAISSVVATNPALQKCDANTIINGALVGEALNLAPSPQLGHYYLVPFDDRKNNRTVATFILGWKGYVQLAIRSGQYRKINVLEIKDGELLAWDPLTEEIKVKLIENDDDREAAETIGYYATFEYVNGFKKAMYWSYKKMLAHAGQYSKAFNAQAYQLLQEGKIAKADEWKYSSFWYKSFDEMAKKTMIRQIISKWGIMSVEMQDAYGRDGAHFEEPDKPTFQENAGEVVENVKDAAKATTGTVPPPPKPEPKPDPATPPITDAEAENLFNNTIPF